MLFSFNSTRRALRPMTLWTTLLLSALAIILGASPAHVHAAVPTTIAVTSTAQSPGSAGDCTFGEAIASANSDSQVDACTATDQPFGSGGPFVIELASSAEYTLTTVDNNGSDGANGLPILEAEVTIHGNGSLLHRDSAAPAFRIFEMSGTTTTINDLTIANGNTGGSGLKGGGIYAFASSVEVDDTIFNGNIASGDGGALVNQSGTLTVKNVTYQSTNHAGGNGGGLYSDGTLYVTDNTFSNNTAGGKGGGLYSDGSADVKTSTFSQNTATGNGGAIFNDGTAYATDSTFSQNNAVSGAAISSDGTVYATGSTFLSNTASADGAGIYAEGGTVYATNNTFAKNTATGNGGGIENPGNSVFVYNSTFSGNSAASGGAVHNDNGGYFQLDNTILADSTSGGNCGGEAVTNDSHNLDTGTTCGFGSDNGSKSNASPNLDGLQDHGGATETMAPQMPGDAIDKGDNGVCAANPVNNVDQRGVARPIDGDGDSTATCDIGSVEVQSVSSTLVVNSTADTNDGTCDPLGTGSGNKDCTLGEAISVANVNADPNIINFKIPDSDTNCDATSHVCTITPASPYAVIKYPVVIDGYTQPGTSPNTLTDGDNAVLRIEINGTNVHVNQGVLEISAGGSTVKGLVINRADGDGIRLNTTGGNTIVGNFIGTDPTGGSDRGNGFDGINIDAISNNTIGGTNPADRNLISANHLNGLLLFGKTATGNLVEGNYVGTDATGTNTLGNGFGIVIEASLNNTVGGANASARNLISGNGTGILMEHQTSTGLSTIQGNYIGIDLSGNNPLGNSFAGINLAQDAQTNTVRGNLISANGRGIRIENGAHNNIIAANLIGTNAAGTGDLGNDNYGIDVFSGNANQIGGVNAADRNIISANGQYGIRLAQNASANKVQGNYVGTDINGTAALGNFFGGVSIEAGKSNVIGGDHKGQGNLISGNNAHGANGIQICGNSAPGNRIQGNNIGTNAAGTGDLGNDGAGIRICGGRGNLIGGTSKNAGNLIGFNHGQGILIEPQLSTTATQNALHRNAVFSNGKLGIDLDSNGVTPNDTGDGDSGSNALQNYPVLKSAIASTRVLKATLASNPQSTFTIEFYASPSCDVSGYGEGKKFIGSTQVKTNGSGNVTFTFTGDSAFAKGQAITATATDKVGDTSEFSKCVMAQ